MDANNTTLGAGYLNSQAAVSKGYAENAAAITESFTESMVNRLHSVMSTLGDANEDLSMLTDRMFGPSPSPVAGASGAKDPGCSRAEILFEMVESIQRRALNITSLARGLNSRI